MGAAWLAAQPALAQEDPAASLDALSQAATGIGSGTELARQQIRSGDLTGAAATLERVLINHPDAGEALLLHATVLCRLDDGDGARVELDELSGRAIPDQMWADVVAACGPIRRPGQGG
jgi:Flp pilus assembly protein TadD